MANAPFALSQVLNLVGSLDDSPGGHTPRERFRNFLQHDVAEVGQLRDYIEECLRTTGGQYARALQDLVNRVGQVLGFAVTYGRYQGVQGQLGFDGYWVSPAGFHVVVEVKTTEVYAIKTDTLVGYVDGLITEGQIPHWESALGLYVVGRPDPEIRQLETIILGQKRTDQLRVISADALLSLAELMEGQGITHDDILAVIRPSGPLVDDIVGLIKRLGVAVQAEEEPILEPPQQQPNVPPSPPLPAPPTGEATAYWLTPVASDKKETAEDIVTRLVGRDRLYAFGEAAPGRKHLKPGDWMAFYATGIGVIGHARVASPPEHKLDARVRDSADYPWVLRLTDVKLYVRQPVVIDAPMRGQLEKFQGKDPKKGWAWLVQTTRELSQHDFDLLTRQ